MIKEDIDKLKSLIIVLEDSEDKGNIIDLIELQVKILKVNLMVDRIDKLTSKEDIPTLTYFTVADVFNHYLGTLEYNGIIATIQKWYYGTLVEASWCATSMCWCLAQLGLRVYTINGKYENVYNLKVALDAGVERGVCNKIDKYNMQYGDVVILCFDNEFTFTANKHVNSFLNYSTSLPNYYLGIGGNQSDGIIPQQYRLEDIVAVYRPQWDKGTLKSLDNLPKG